MEAHLLCADPSCWALGELPVDVRLTIDGRTHVDWPAAGGSVTVTPAPSDNGMTTHLRFTVTGIGLLAEDDDTEHTVELVLSSYFQDSA